MYLLVSEITNIWNLHVTISETVVFPPLSALRDFGG